MSNKLCLVLSVILTATMLLAACAPAAAPVQPTTAPAATAAPVQPTTAPGEIPQSGDLCGGTGGNGQIVSVGNNEFTMKRNDNGSDQVVHLTSQATIKTTHRWQKLRFLHPTMGRLIFMLTVIIQEFWLQDLLMYLAESIHLELL